MDPTHDDELDPGLELLATQVGLLDNIDWFKGTLVNLEFQPELACPTQEERNGKGIRVRGPWM